MLTFTASKPRKGGGEANRKLLYGDKAQEPLVIFTGDTGRSRGKKA